MVLVSGRFTALGLNEDPKQLDAVLGIIIEETGSCVYIYGLYRGFIRILF